MQLRAPTGHHQSIPWTSHKELYPVEVSFDLQEMDAAAGVSMVFDKKRHIMRLDPGMTSVGTLAWGRFDDRISGTGWSELSVQTSPSKTVSNDVKMYSAGFAEGVLSCVRISDFYANTHQLLMKRESSSHALAEVKKLFRSQISFMKEKANIREHIVSEEPENAYWKHARYLLFQLWGVCDGYNFVAQHFGISTLGLEDMLVLNAGAELAQLMEAYSTEVLEHRLLIQSTLSFLQRGPEHGSTLQAASSLRAHRAPKASGEDPLDDDHWEHRLAESGRCSAFVRVSDGRQDLFVGHTTWDDYSKMTRIFKYYKFNLANAETVAADIAFSSYPGVISSTDDFYITDSGLVAMETSIEVLDSSVWDKVRDFQVHPRLPSFVHTMITNRMAKSAAHWVRLFSKADSGASASQWMVVDYNLFKVGAAVQDNTLWILEVIPGAMKIKDMSYFLREHGFWPSFNRPFFNEIREISGHAAAERSHGSLYSWSANPRATIFANSAASINGLFDMRGLMRRNMYSQTASRPNGPGHEISARMDLSPQRPLPNGGIDAKVVSRCLVARLQAQVASGPSHERQRPFRWRSSDGTEMWPGWPHIGLPDVWDFGFVQLSPAGFKDLVDDAAC